jgi:geranyl-CoA carboxylase alpha subunit
MKLRLFHRGEPIEVELEATADGHRVRIGERLVEIRRLAGDGEGGAVAIDGKPVRYLVDRAGDSIRVAVGGELHEFELGGAKSGPRAGHGVASPETRSPIPGKVLKLETEVGAAVVPGDPLLILEAMKMENVLVAEVAGTVKEITVRAGEMVEPGKLLVVIEPAG